MREGMPARRARPASMPYRLTQLFCGLILYGVSIAMLVRADLGLVPWSVLDQGLSRQFGWSLGTSAVLSGLVIMLFWLPLRLRPGFGTVSNVLVIGPAIDVALWVFPPTEQPWLRGALVAAAILLNGLATSLYIGASFGPGPRDGLMTGLTAVTGLSVRLVRTALEVVVVAIGWLLGGTVGIGTVLYALAIGPIVHVLLPRVTTSRRPGPGPTAGEEGAA